MEVTTVRVQPAELRLKLHARSDNASYVFALTILYSGAISTWALLRLIFRTITTLGNSSIRVLDTLADPLGLIFRTPLFLIRGLFHV